MKKELIAQMIGANLPDNNTKAITPAKLRQIEDAMVSTFDGNRAKTGMFNVYWNGQGADTEIFFQFLGAGTIVEADKPMYALCLDYYTKKSESHKNRGTNFKRNRTRWRCALPSGKDGIMDGVQRACLGSPSLLSEDFSSATPEIILSWFSLMGESNDHSDAEISLKKGYIKIGCNHNGHGWVGYESKRRPATVNTRVYLGNDSVSSPIVRREAWPTLLVRAALVRYKGSSRTPTLSQIGSAYERVYMSDIVAIQCKPSDDFENGIEKIQYTISNRTR